MVRDFFSFDDETSDQLYLLNYILFERRKEFIGQGMRWYDIRRFNISVEHQFPGGSFITLESEDPRKQLQIPTSAVEVGGLDPNKRE